MKQLMMPLLVLLICASLLRAGSLDRKRLPADTKWFVHLDAAAARHSPIVQALEKAFLAQPNAKEGVQFIRNTFGVDPLKDVQEITVYNTSFTPDEAVIMARSKNVDKGKLLDLLRLAADFREDKHGSHAFYSWTEQSGARAGQTTSGAFVGDDTVLMGPGEAAVKHELDVIDGKAKSAADDERLPDAKESEAFLEGGAVGLADAEMLTAKSPLVKEAESIALAIGERAGNTFFKAELKTKNPDVAAKAAKVLAGLQAFAELQFGDNPDVTQFVHPAKISNDGTTVRVNWQAPDEQVVNRLNAEIRKHQPEKEE